MPYWMWMPTEIYGVHLFGCLADLTYFFDFFRNTTWINLGEVHTELSQGWYSYVAAQGKHG